MKQQTAVEWLVEKLDQNFDYVADTIIEQAKEMEKEQMGIIPYQLCPKCNGQGQVSKPPYIAGDVHEWSSSSCIFSCDVCNGSKIIPMYQTKQINYEQ